MNNKLVGDVKQPSRVSSVSTITKDSKIYIGGADTRDTKGRRFRNGEFTVDEVDTWDLDRDTLVAHNYLVRGI